MKDNTCTVCLAFGDIAKIKVTHEGSVIQLAIYEHREDEPLIVADLTDEEQQTFIRALNKEEALV